MDSLRDFCQRHAVCSGLILGLVCLVVTGCGGGHDTVPVSGVVTLDGKPVANVSVTFQPIDSDAADPGPGSHGVTGPDGRYTLQLSTPEAPPGAIVGQHRVLLAVREPDSETEGPGSYQDPQVKLPPNASDGSLTFTVPEGGTDQANFELTSQ